MIKKLLPILFVLIITSCSKEVPSDQLVERGNVVYEVNSQTPFTGSSVSSFYNGQLREKTNYKNGKENGLYESYHENGQLKLKGNFKNGEVDGLIERYFENGQLGSRQNYTDGEKDGLQQIYKRNGKLIKSQCYQDGYEVAMSHCE